MSEMCEPRSSRFILWLLLLLYALKEISWNWFSQRLNESRSQILLNIHKKYCLIKKLMWSDISWLQIGSWWTFWFVLVWQFSSYETSCAHLSLSLKRKKRLRENSVMLVKKSTVTCNGFRFINLGRISEKILYNLILNVSTWFSFNLKLIRKYPTSFTVASWYCKTRIKPLTKWNDGITLSLKYFSRYSNKISLYVPSQCNVTICYKGLTSRNCIIVNWQNVFLE